MFQSQESASMAPEAKRGPIQIRQCLCRPANHGNDLVLFTGYFVCLGPIVVCDRELFSLASYDTLP